MEILKEPQSPCPFIPSLWVALFRMTGFDALSPSHFTYAPLIFTSPICTLPLLIHFCYAYITTNCIYYYLLFTIFITTNHFYYYLLFLLLLIIFTTTNYFYYYLLFLLLLTLFITTYSFYCYLLFLLLLTLFITTYSFYYYYFLIL